MIDDLSEVSRAFQISGCYLVDLCREPVDHLDVRSRRAACIGGELLLSRTIRRLRPAKIITVVRSIEANVTRAIVRAGWHGALLHLPYPGKWSRHKDTFVKDLVESVTLLMSRQHRSASKRITSYETSRDIR